MRELEEATLTYRLPARMPEELLCEGKTYKRLGGAASVNRGVCNSNDGSWHYYFNKQRVEEGGPIGNRRHFSIHSAANARSIHISMKASEGKRDDIMIWYRYDEQWTGNRREPAGWGRTRFGGQDAVRVAKAVGLLTKFLEAMTAAAEGGPARPAAPIAPVLSPPIAAIPVFDAEEAERAFAASRAAPVVVTHAPSEVDDWEDL